jgi:hypothetical protein
MHDTTGNACAELGRDVIADPAPPGDWLSFQTLNSGLSFITPLILTYFLGAALVSIWMIDGRQ